jgi:purine-binding chemotaxis protein CheW
MNDQRPVSRAALLRREFDRSFAEAPQLEAERTEDLLAIRVGGDPYALRLSEVAGLFADRRVTPLPSPLPELLGLAGFRGALVPVYDLGSLLGYHRAEAPRWLVSIAGGASAALAFERFEAQLRFPRAAIASDGARADRYAREVVRTPEAMRPVLHLPSVLEAIKARVRHGARPKER